MRQENPAEPNMSGTWEFTREGTATMRASRHGKLIKAQKGTYDLTGEVLHLTVESDDPTDRKRSLGVEFPADDVLILRGPGENGPVAEFRRAGTK